MINSIKMIGVAVFVLMFGLSACKSSAPLDNNSQQDTLNTIEHADSNGSTNSVAANSESTTLHVDGASSSGQESSSSNLSDYNQQSGTFNLLARETIGWDETGWSTFEPSEDSRLIYVSSSDGNDSTAEYYAPLDIADIEHPGNIKPFKTIHAAIDRTRKGYPDWILLRRGDEWEVKARAELKAGRSITERSVLTSYGPSPSRPILSRSDGREMIRIWSNRNYVIVRGISFYAKGRDPESPSFLGWGNLGDVDGILIYGPEGTRMGSILIEDNHFNFLSKGISIDGEANHIDIVIRRNIIRNSFSENGHAQGMGASSASVLLEENIFDHNGWLIQQGIKDGRDQASGQATMFNHNTYFRRSKNTIFRNNIFLRPSSIHNKWTANPTTQGVDDIVSENLVMENNLYVEGEIGISAGGNDDYDTGHRWANIKIRNNIMLGIGRGRPTNRNLAWYIDAIDWDGGVICGNYLLKNDDLKVQNINGIKLNGHSRNVSVSNNLIYDLIMSSSSNNNGGLRINSAPKSNIRIFDNNFQLTGSLMRPIITDNIDSLIFEDNIYSSGADSDQWFRVNGDNLSFSDWQPLVSDLSSSAEQRSFSEPERDFKTYLTSIGLNASINDFVDSASSQPERTWDERYSAKKINDYIREGYGNTSCE